MGGERRDVVTRGGVEGSWWRRPCHALPGSRECDIEESRCFSFLLFVTSLARFPDSWAPSRFFGQVYWTERRVNPGLFSHLRIPVGSGQYDHGPLKPFRRVNCRNRHHIVAVYEELGFRDFRVPVSQALPDIEKAAKCQVSIFFERMMFLRRGKL